MVQYFCVVVSRRGGWKALAITDDKSHKYCADERNSPAGDEWTSLMCLLEVELVTSFMSDSSALLRASLGYLRRIKDSRSNSVLKWSSRGSTNKFLNNTCVMTNIQLKYYSLNYSCRLRSESVFCVLMCSSFPVNIEVACPVCILILITGSANGTYCDDVLLRPRSHLTSFLH